MKEFNKILITGSTGFLGSHLIPVLKKETNSEIIAVGSKDYDLLKPGVPEEMLKETNPDCVIHMAAKSGGIITNKKHPADFYYENIVINTHTFEASFRHGVEKFITFMGGCSYPSNAKSPIGEDQMWNGFPQMESSAYSVAKKVLLVQSDSYRRQHNFNSIVLVPGNVYGEYDNFNEEQSHVIPALIKRFVEAQEQGVDSVTCYGSGKPTRDFVYAGDVANLIPWFLNNYDSSEPVNISSGSRISIKKLAELIKLEVGFDGNINWDTSKPDGQLDKIFSVERLRSLDMSCPTSLSDGIKKTVSWFKEAKKKGKVRV